MSQELNFDEIRNALDKIYSWCEPHEMYNEFGYYWRCRCGKKQEIRLPEHEQQKMKELWESVPKGDPKDFEIQEIFGIKIAVEKNKLP